MRKKIKNKKRLNMLQEFSLFKKIKKNKTKRLCSKSKNVVPIYNYYDKDKIIAVPSEEHYNITFHNGIKKGENNEKYLKNEQEEVLEELDLSKYTQFAFELEDLAVVVNKIIRIINKRGGGKIVCLSVADAEGQQILVKN